MYRKTDCRAYMKWKEERAKKSKKKRKVKKERKELTADCIDEDEIEDTAKLTLKINYRKCKKKKKKKKKIPGRLIRKIYKRVSFAELVLNCIKPSIKEREYLLNQRHADCIGLIMPMIVIEPETTKPSQIYPASRQKSDKKVIPCIKDKRRRKKRRRRKLEDSEPEDSECESICSFDSEVCLEGIKLTSRDNEEIEKYQSETQEAIAREETDET